MNMTKILEPVAEKETPTGKEPLLTCLDSIAGKRIAFVSNEWRSLGVILARLRELFLGEGQVSETFKVVVPATGPRNGSTLDDVARRCDAAIVGLAN